VVTTGTKYNSKVNQIIQYSGQSVFHFERWTLNWVNTSCRVCTLTHTTQMTTLGFSSRQWTRVGSTWLYQNFNHRSLKLKETRNSVEDVLSRPSCAWVNHFSLKLSKCQKQFGCKSAATKVPPRCFWICFAMFSTRRPLISRWRGKGEKSGAFLYGTYTLLEKGFRSSISCIHIYICIYILIYVCI